MAFTGPPTSSARRSWLARWSRTEGVSSPSFSRRSLVARMASSLHVKGVHLAGSANQPGQENRIVPVARRGVHDCVPGETTRLIQS